MHYVMLMYNFVENIERKFIYAIKHTFVYNLKTKTELIMCIRKSC